MAKLKTYSLDFKYDFEWQGAGRVKATSAKAAIAQGKKSAKASGWKMPRGTKWRAKLISTNPAKKRTAKKPTKRARAAKSTTVTTMTTKTTRTTTSRNPKRNIWTEPKTLEVEIEQDGTGAVTITPTSAVVRRNIEEHLAQFGERGAGVLLEEWRGDEWLDANLSKKQRKDFNVRHLLTIKVSPYDYGMWRGWDLSEFDFTADGPETNPLRLGKQDKSVIRAFTEQRTAEGHKLHTDGEHLSGYWTGGNNIAYWTDGKIHLPDIGSKAGQTVQNAVRKEAPKNDLFKGRGWNPTGDPHVYLHVYAEDGFEKSTTSEKVARATAKRGSKRRRGVEYRIYTTTGTGTRGGQSLVAIYRNGVEVESNPSDPLNGRRRNPDAAVTIRIFFKNGESIGVQVPDDVAEGNRAVPDWIESTYGSDWMSWDYIEDNPAKGKTFEVGDLVRYTTNFLRSTGQYASKRQDGVVVGHVINDNGTSRPDFPIVSWNDYPIPSSVNAANIEKKKTTATRELLLGNVRMAIGIPVGEPRGAYTTWTRGTRGEGRHGKDWFTARSGMITVPADAVNHAVRIHDDEHVDTLLTDPNGDVVLSMQTYKNPALLLAETTSVLIVEEDDEDGTQRNPAEGDPSPARQTNPSLRASSIGRRITGV